MGDILRIYSGGAQVNLYDSTNGVLHLGYASEDILIESEPQVVPLSDGNRVEVQEMISFEATLLETDSTKIDNIIARKGYLQEVYIIGLDSAYKFRDCFIRIKEIRSMKAGEVHQLVISGRRFSQSVDAAIYLPETNYCQFIQNILGGFGAMLGAGSSPTGWSSTGATSQSLDTSHLGGGYGNEYRFTLSDSGDRVFILVRMPVDQLSIKVTASAYIDNRKSGTSYFDFGIVTFATIAGGIIDSDYDSVELSNGENDRITKTLTFTPSASIQYLGLRILGSDSGTCELGVDNAQIEFGELTDYVENA